MFDSIKSFISYWYFRYLLVTDLFMVEKWERAAFHIMVLFTVLILYVFNTTILLEAIKAFSGWINQKDLSRFEHEITFLPIRR
ncbi:unnamed protein product [Phyllotreta striolata]|uniref:Uncharacterized protein n=1 Tax=Phyllotreta striolata TaxID=444603 RepID=A0A9N9TCQ8_PHYSR|nr:unnamed protein product [Phyllotreta striolata]